MCLCIFDHMNTSESYGRNFNRRQVKWALRTESGEVALYMKGLPPLDMVRLTSKMFEELRLRDFHAFMLACREAINRVEVHDNDKREMLDAIILEIQSFGEGNVTDPKKITNLAIATYFSLSRVTEMASFMKDASST